MKHMVFRKTFLYIFAFLLFFISILSCNNSSNTSEPKAIHIVTFQVVEFELINNMRRIFEEELQKTDFAKDNNLQCLPYKDGHNDINLINQISDQLIADKPDLIYVLGTPVAQALVQRTNTIPIVQGAVTDPVSAKLAKSWEGSGRNYAASTDFPPVMAQFKILKEIFPNAKNIGTIYNSGEANTVALMGRVRPVLQNMGFELIERSVTGTGEVSSATTALIGKVDAIYVPTDNTVVAALPSLLEIANDNMIPVMASTKEDVKIGALLALGVSYNELSVLAARIAIRILEGENPAKIPIAFAENPYLYLNHETAGKLGVEIPDEVKKKVSTWFKNGEEIPNPYN